MCAPTASMMSSVADALKIPRFDPLGDRIELGPRSARARSRRAPRSAAARSRAIAAPSGSAIVGRRREALEALLDHVEIARPPNAAAGRRERGDRHPGGLADASQEEPSDRARLFQASCARRGCAPAPVRRGRETAARPTFTDCDQQGPAVLRPGVARAWAQAAFRRVALARSRSANFCTLPVEVFGISAKTIVRGHL